MNTVYEDIIIQKLLSYSVEKTDYEVAKTEWVFEGKVIDNGPIKDQIIKKQCALCHHPIRYEYIIKNTKNNTLLSVGSECLGNYEIVHFCKIESALKKLKTDQYNNCMNAFRGASWTIGNMAYHIRRMIEESGLSWNNPTNTHLVNDLKTLNTNNEVVVFKELSTGAVQDIAKKYDLPIRNDYIETFLSVYQTANKDKNGFFRRA